MSFYRQQLFTKKEIDAIIDNNIIDYSDKVVSSTEKEFWPGRKIKLCLSEEGVVKWIPGRVLSFIGTNEKCTLQVAIHIQQDIYFNIVIYDTNTIMFDSTKET